MKEGEVFPNSLVNLHCHSHYCGHGEGELSEFADAAIDGGMKVLGYSEHCPLPDERFSKSRMPYAMLGTYFKDAFGNKVAYRHNLNIFVGAECDWCPEYESFYRDEILGRYGVDYLIMSIHSFVDSDGQDKLLIHSRDTNDPRLLAEYADRYIQGLKSGLFLFGCHPDLFGAMYTDWDEQAIACSKAIIEAAIDCNMPLEVNGLGITRGAIRYNLGTRHVYPVEPFWELAKDMGVKTIVSSDSHCPGNVAGEGRRQAMQFAEAYGLPLVSITEKNGRLAIL